MRAALVPLLLSGALAVAQPGDAPPAEKGDLVVPEGYVLQVLGAIMWLKDMDIVAVSTFGAPRRSGTRWRTSPRSCQS